MSCRTAPGRPDAIRRDPDLKVISSRASTSPTGLSTPEAALRQDERVRQALNMAIDKAAIIKDVYQGAGQAAKNLIPPTIWSYNDAVKDYPYDPEKAKAMLEEAGVATPLEIDLWYMPVQRPYNPNAKRIAEMMQADLAKVGINAKLVTYEWGEYRKRVQQGEHHDGASSAGPATMAIPTTSSSCAAARLRRAGGQNIAQVVQQGVRRPAEQGQARWPTRRSAPSSTRRCRSSRRRRRLS